MTENNPTEEEHWQNVLDYVGDVLQLKGSAQFLRGRKAELERLRKRNRELEPKLISEEEQQAIRELHHDR